jgi:hypothetical protein
VFRPLKLEGSIGKMTFEEMPSYKSVFAFSESDDDDTKVCKEG